MQKNFAYRIIGCQAWDTCDDNVDIEIDLPDGSRYTATFFTVLNVRTIMNKNAITGECAGGIYLWSSSMIIVEDLKPETIELTIAGLIENKELDAVCCRLH